MVFPDSSIGVISSLKSFKIASIADRCVAFALDVLIFFPIVQIILFQIIKKTQLMYFMDSASSEFSLLLFVGIVLIAAIVLLLQTLFLYYWGGTPGKLFLKLRVVSTVESSQRLSLSQCLVRSLLWVLEAAMLLVPFLEILSHRYRRAIHDRAAETIVVTLKNEEDSGPHPLEAHFVRQVLFICSAFFAFWVLISTAKVYYSVVSGEYKSEKSISKNLRCDQIESDTPARVDEALALYLADAVNADCLEAEVSFALWNVDEEQKSWGYLAKAFLNKFDKKLSNSYMQQVCKSASDSTACKLTETIKDGGVHDLTTFTGQVLAIEKLDSSGDYKKILEILPSVSHPLLNSFVIKQQMKSYWALGEQEKSRGVFAAGLISLPFDERNNLRSWMCLEEVHTGCPSADTQFACQYTEVIADRMSEEIAWSMLKNQQCLGSHNLNWSQFKGIISKNRNFGKLMTATFQEQKDAQLSLDKRILLLKEVIKGSTDFVRQMAIAEWMNLEHSDKAWNEIYNLMAQESHRDWFWQRQIKKAYEVSLKRKNSKLTAQFSRLLNLDTPIGKRLPASVQQNSEMDEP